jgi:AcrR family transcriptional regulator
VPTSRRERPAKPALPRDGIVAAAVAVLRAEGLDKVTMRRLAQELDTGAASLYVYVANTDELHAAVLDELLGGVAAPREGSWDERVDTLLGSYVGVLFAHPGLARSALSARPSGEHYLALIETLLGLLAEGGVPAARAAWGVDLLLQYATATAAEHATRARNPTAGDDWDALTRAIRSADPAARPHLHAVAGAIQSGTPQARTTWGIAALLRGIAGTPVPEERP